MKYLVIAAAILCFATFVYAEETTNASKGWFASYQRSIMDWEDDGIKNKIHWANNIEAGYSFNDYLEVGAEGSHIKTYSDKGSSFKQSTLLATFKLKYPLTKRFSPYILAGIGQSWFWDKDLNFRQPETLPAIRGLAHKYGIGFQYGITKHFTFFTEGVYRYADTGFWDYEHNFQTSLDVYGWSYGGGIKIYF